MNRIACSELGIQIDYLDGHSIRAHLHTIFNELLSGTYEYDVQGKTVVDVGAFYGETAIYYSRIGAAKVICYEPFASGRLIPHNASLNGCTNIEWVHAAVAGKDAVLEADPEHMNHGGTRLYYANTPGEALSQISLQSITETHQIKDGVLKLDCEGSEYDIIFQTKPETLRQYSVILMEVHTYLGNVDILGLKLMEAGFKVNKADSVSIRSDLCQNRPFWKCDRKD
jgi:FkbM family methyltransferase